MAALLSMDDFVGYLMRTIDVPDVALRPDQTLASQVTLDSVRMVELAIVLEQELGLDLPDDLDLRQATFTSLYQCYAEGSALA